MTVGCAPHTRWAATCIPRVVPPHQIDAEPDHVLLPGIHGGEGREDNAQRLSGLRADIVAPISRRVHSVLAGGEDQRAGALNRHHLRERRIAVQGRRVVMFDFHE